jgi:hypothetical protein
MYTKQSFIIIVILLVAIILAVVVSFLITTDTIISLLPPYDNIITTIIFQEPNSSSNRIKDSTEDVKLISIYNTKILPVVRDYHDIISASVDKIDYGNKMIFTMDLAGDANKNEKYETVYLWLIYYTSNLYARNQQQQQFYTLIIPNFPSSSNFENKNGWYLAIFNNTDSTYTLPLSKISTMPENKVQVFVDPTFIGNPQSFNYVVSTMVRVNSSYLNKPPDYLVDSAPDGNELFWLKWFS